MARQILLRFMNKALPLAFPEIVDERHTVVTPVNPPSHDWPADPAEAGFGFIHLYPAL